MTFANALKSAVSYTGPALSVASGSKGGPENFGTIAFDKSVSTENVAFDAPIRPGLQVVEAARNTMT